MRVFLSYRRDDTAGHAGRLYDALTARFGEAAVFMDVDTIRPGADFVSAVEEAVRSCDALIALIGRSWTSMAGPDGVRRLEREDDLVRREIETALEAGVRVIPVLVHGAHPPAEADLPGRLAELARRNAIELSDGRWRYDLGRLLETLEELEREQALGTAAPSDWGRPELRLPVPATSFLGREEELEQLRELLQQPGTRLLTLTGPPGIGKTRLAVEAAAATGARFPDGVVWVSLSALADPALFPLELAQALGLRETSAQSVQDALAESLKGTRLLLLLDNAEHLLPAVAEDVAALLASSPTVAFLVTSRERLGLTGEHVYAVPVLSERDGIDLFCARARALDPAFAETPAVAELCRRLDRLPLALELAAARTPLFTPEQLVERLAQRLDLLKAGRGVDPRQQTLRATLEWSYDLLDEAERILFERLSVFAGGCTWDAAERVAEADPDALQSLLEKSLVRRRQDPGVDPRFTMLESIREFAAERLDASRKEGELRTRHAKYFLQLAEESDRAVREGEEQAPVLRRLAVEHDNLRAALAWLPGLGEPDLELRLATALGYLWEVQGHFSLGQQPLEAALARTGERDASPLRGRALMYAGLLAHDRGEYPRARERLEASLEVSRKLGDDRLAARALGNLGIVATAEEDLQRATELYEHTLALLAGLEDDRALGATKGNLGYVKLLQGDVPGARELFEEAAALLDSVNDDVPLVMMQVNLALVELEAGAGARAEEVGREALELSHRLGYREGIWSSLAVLAAAEDQPRRAAVLLGAGRALREADEGALQPFERDVEERTASSLRAELGAEELARLCEDGAAMEVDEAVGYALAGGS